MGATPGLSGGGGVEETGDTSFENNNRPSSQSKNNISCSNSSLAVLPFLISQS